MYVSACAAGTKWRLDGSDAPLAATAGPEAVLLIGPPACGKSTITSVHFPTYTRVNQAWACFDFANDVPTCVIDRFAAWQDLLKTRKKCLDVAAAELAAGHSVVIDATNKDASVRGYACLLSVGSSKSINHGSDIADTPRVGSVGACTQCANSSSVCGCAKGVVHAHECISWQ